MSELTRLRDHCRRMSTAPLRDGDLTAADRTLFGMLADEIDTYLAGDDDEQPTQTGPDLFGTGGE